MQICSTVSECATPDDRPEQEGEAKTRNTTVIKARIPATVGSEDNKDARSGLANS